MKIMILLTGNLGVTIQSLVKKAELIPEVTPELVPVLVPEVILRPKSPDQVVLLPGEH